MVRLPLIQHLLNDSLLSILLPLAWRREDRVCMGKKRTKTIFESLTATKVVQQKDWLLLGFLCPAHPSYFYMDIPHLSRFEGDCPVTLILWWLHEKSLICCLSRFLLVANRKAAALRPQVRDKILNN